MGTSIQLRRIATRLLWVAGIVGVVSMTGSAGANDEVTYVETVRCQAGVCEPLHKTVPMVQVVRQPDGANFCIEFTRRLTGFKSVPSIDPAVQIQIPQFEESGRHYVRCGQDAVARSKEPQRTVQSSVLGAM